VRGYNGDVVPGGPAEVRTLPRLVISKISVGPHDNDAYLLRCAATGEQLLIDAADEPGRLLELIGDGGLATIVTTHSHDDHWQALNAVAETTGAKHVTHRLDAPDIPRPADRLVDEGDRVTVGDCPLEVIHLAGHTPGGIALLYRDPKGIPHLFSGDSLFPGGVGNTDNDPARFAQLLGDVERKVFDRLPDETWVYPGHGKDTVLGRERPHLTEWHDRGW
jgi:glyoxylase-like metal-dependent hydrolase (beta-lactamase superfamily II)